MTILIDDRVGSKHYAELIGDEAVVTRLDFGDVAFDGGGSSVGIEIKKVSDAVNCLYSGRLADHQIPGLRSSYDISYLIIEGLYRGEPNSGILQSYKGELGKWGRWHDVVTGRQRLLYSQFENWLSTLSLTGGVILRSTPAAEVTASLLMSLHAWHSKTRHSSFQTMQEHMGAELTRPTMLRRMISLLPRIGWQRSATLSARFHSVKQLADAPPQDFLLENEIAMPTALKIWAAIHGEEYEQNNRR